MSIIRPWTNGDQVALDAGRVPVKTWLYDANGLPWVQDANGGMPVNSIITDSTGNELTLEPNGSLPVTLQDQTTPPIIVYANQVTNTTTLSVAASVDDLDITVTSAVGINDGDYTGIFSTVTDRFYAGTVLSQAGNVLTMDTPIDSEFPIGATVGTGIRDMAVDGSATTQVFGLRGADPGIDITVDITRIIIQMTTSNPTEFTMFGDIIGGLTRGIVMRRVDGSTQNYFNIKVNSEIANIAFDFNTLEQAKPSGVNGIVSRLTFAGQNKMGVVSRIGPGENLEVLIQDDLTQLLSFTLIFEGSVAII